MANTKVYHIGQDKDENKQVSSEAKRIHKININNVDHERKSEDRTNQSNVRFTAANKDSVKNKKADKNKVKKLVNRAKTAGALIFLVTALVLAQRTTRSTEKIGIIAEDGTVFDTKSLKNEEINEGEVVTIEGKTENGDFEIKYLDADGNEKTGTIKKEELVITDLKREEFDKYKYMYRVKKDNTEMLDRNFKDVEENLPEDCTILGTNKTITKNGERYIEVIYITPKGVTKGYVEAKSLELSEIQTDNKIQTVKKKAIIGTGRKEIVTKEGKHIGWIDSNNSDIYATESSEKLGTEKWRKVVYYDQEDNTYKEGYIQEKYLQEETISMQVNTDKDNGANLNVRKEPNIDSKRIDELENGIHVNIVKETVETPIIGEDGKSYYKVIIAKNDTAEGYENYDGYDPLSGRLYVDGVFYEEGYVNANYLESIGEKAIQIGDEVER